MSAFDKAKKTTRAAAAALLNVAKGKADAAVQTTADVTAKAPAKAKADNWNQTPGPRS